MTQTAQEIFDRSHIELLLQENKLIEALALLGHGAPEGLSERETYLYVLLARAHLDGPESCEEDVDALRGISDLNRREKDLVRRIFLYAFQVAEKAGQEEKRWAYQRLLRRLLLGQPLDQPIPITPNLPRPRRRVIMLEPAAIVCASPEPALARERDGAMIYSGEKTMRRSALGICAACLLVVPLVYIASRSVSPPVRRSDAATSSIPAEALRLDYVAEQRVALHEEPRLASSILEQIDRGTRIAVLAVQGDWFKVRTAHSRSAGFVRKKFVARAGFTR